MKSYDTPSHDPCLHRGEEPKSFSGPLFVSGVWRSGTSLLYALLNQHPDIRLFYEGELPMLRPMFRFAYSRTNWHEKWEYWNASLSRHGLDSFVPSASITSLAEAAEAVGREYCKSKGAKIWGCKSPSYYDRLVQLVRDFPTARFIVIWRDPESICRSVVNAATSSRWFASSGMLHRAILGCEMLKKQCDKLVDLGIPVHQIHYKDLVDDTPNTMRGICQFLEIPFIPNMASLEGADRSAVFPGAHHSVLNGTKIVSDGNRKGHLPHRIEKKVQQYKVLWKEQFGERWLLSRHFKPLSAKTPSKWDQLRDRFFFSLLRAKDAMRPKVYSAMPLGIWRLYRAIKYRDPDYIKHHNRAAIDQPTTKVRQYVAKQGT